MGCWVMTGLKLSQSRTPHEKEAVLKNLLGLGSRQRGRSTLELGEETRSRRALDSGWCKAGDLGR